MSGDSAFATLMKRVRGGDEAAATELVREFEPELRREIRLRLTDPKLRIAVDSMDICQSVLGNFFVRAAVGQFEIDRPQQLVRLLATMARNKVIDRHRREKLRRPDEDPPAEAGGERVSFDETPSAIVANRELLDEFHARLSTEEQLIAEQRREGCSWDEIGLTVGSSGEAVRKRFGRACDRVADELGLNS
ncbi:MAG: sigma-70 family RNA polymerase sigma factor [Pirellulaceae bacterium]|nr:sigma-70 family RNA polymerase sigma factor [Pirellulaceae bacterium]MDP7016984.1 sigma-70 family RNA polymerase sigma factor [Pirellulaceae bacterium]